MIKEIIVLIVLILLAVSASAEVVVYQVLYDPISSESGGEAVELKNTGKEAIDVSGWVLATDASEKDAVLPENTLLLPGRTYLVADENWNDKKDNPAWRNAEYQETITLGNTNGWVKLLTGEEVKDAVSWGNSTIGQHSPSVEPGKAIRRVGDEFEEAQADFFEGIPVALTADITIQVPVLEITPSLHLAPEGVLKIRNGGTDAITVTLKIGSLSYKN